MLTLGVVHAVRMIILSSAPTRHRTLGSTSKECTVLTANTIARIKCAREEDEAEVSESPYVKGLVQAVNIDTFRYYLTRWIVERHIPFTVVEDTAFRAMLSSLNLTVQDYLIKSDSIRDWVEGEFREAKKLVREDVITKASSTIHISCDIWTSPNGYALCCVVAHLVGHQGVNQSVLLGLKRMMAGYGGEQVSEIMVAVLQEFQIVGKLGAFIEDKVD